VGYHVLWPDSGKSFRLTCISSQAHTKREHYRQALSRVADRAEQEDGRCRQDERTAGGQQIRNSLNILAPVKHRISEAPLTFYGLVYASANTMTEREGGVPADPHHKLFSGKTDHGLGRLSVVDLYIFRKVKPLAVLRIIHSLITRKRGPSGH